MDAVALITYSNCSDVAVSGVDAGDNVTVRVGRSKTSLNGYNLSYV